jgi:hypothetical protein
VKAASPGRFEPIVESSTALSAVAETSVIPLHSAAPSAAAERPRAAGAAPPPRTVPAPAASPAPSAASPAEGDRDLYDRRY